MRAVRSGPRRAHRPAAPDRVRCAPALRARHRPRADARRGRGRHGDDPGSLRRRARRGRRKPALDPDWQRTATLRFERSPASAVPTFRRTKRSPRWNDWASPCRAATRQRVTVAVPSWRNDIAAPRSRWTSRRDARPRDRARRPPRAAPRSSRNATWSRRCCGCAASTRSRRCRCRAPHRCRSPTLTPAAGAHRAGPPHPGRPGPGRVRHLQLHGAEPRRRCSATRRRALRLINPIAADLDQLRPTPIATLALAAKRNAARGYPDVALFEIGPDFASRCHGEPAAGRRRAARRRDAAQLARAGPPVGCDGRQGRPVGRHGGDRRAAGCADADRRTHPASITRAARPRCARDRRPALGSFGELHPRVLAALDLTGPVVAFELDLGCRRPTRSAAARLPRTCRHSSRSGATSPSWWIARSPPTPCCGPPGRRARR